jgi:hypothetical protein
LVVLSTVFNSSLQSEVISLLSVILKYFFLFAVCSLISSLSYSLSLFFLSACVWNFLISFRCRFFFLHHFEHLDIEYFNVLVRWPPDFSFISVGGIHDPSIGFVG